MSKSIKERIQEQILKKQQQEKEELTNAFNKAINKSNMSEKKVIYSKWMRKGPKTYIPTDDSSVFKDEVAAGIYELRFADGIGFYMFQKEVHLDDLIEFPTSIHKEVLDSIREFWSRKDKFIEYGFAFKRGILLHGKPGSGKTGIINLSVKYMIEDLNGVVLSLNSKSDLNRYAEYVPEIFRIIEPNRPVVVIFEDIEAFTEYSETESTLLNILDGLDQMENVVYVATTNYIERLKERIINRPSRFDRRIYVPFLDYDSRKYFFEKKLKPHDLEKINLNEWTNDTEGMSIAHLAELIKSVIIFGNSYESSIKMLRELQDINNLHSSKYEKSSGSIGFAAKRGILKETSYGNQECAPAIPDDVWSEKDICDGE